MQKRAGVKTGLLGGFIIALIYVGMLWARYTYFSYNPFVFLLSSFIGFGLFVVLLVLLARQRKKELNNLAEIKDLFQTLFVAIIIVEVVCYIYNYFYLTAINPDFYLHYEQGLIDFAKSRNMPAEQIEEKVKAVRESAVDSKQFWAPILGIFSRIVLDSIFAVVIAYVMKTGLKSEDIQKLRAQQSES